jgi:hypothetical protein
MNHDKIVFIIAHKYYRNTPHYIDYYVKNIQTFYPNALTIIVDNQSTHMEDLTEKLKGITVLINRSNDQFELGAYKYGIQYLMDQHLVDQYDYCVFTQDTFVVKNKYDFNVLSTHNITAACIYDQPQNPENEFANGLNNILTSIGRYNYRDEYTFCCCNSFILHSSKIVEFLEICRPIITTDKLGSRYSEYFLARIVFELNNYKMFAIQGGAENIIPKYDCFNPSIIYQTLPPDVFFAKHIGQLQVKNENKEDLVPDVLQE